MIAKVKMKFISIAYRTICLFADGDLSEMDLIDQITYQNVQKSKEYSLKKELKTNRF